jgi:hypothetical protein
VDEVGRALKSLWTYKGSGQLTSVCRIMGGPQSDSGRYEGVVSFIQRVRSRVGRVTGLNVFG